MSSVIDEQVEEQVEEHMASATLPGMKFVKAAPEEEPLPGGEDVRDVVQKASGIKPAFPREAEPPKEPEKEEAEPEAEEAEPEEEPASDAVGSFMDRLGFKKKDKSAAEPEIKEAKEEEPEEEPEEEAKEEPESEEETKAGEEPEESKPKRKRRKQEGINAEEIKEIIRETAQSVSQQHPVPEAEPQSRLPVESSIEVKNRADLDTFSEMEADPKYDGIRQKYLDYLTKLSGYKANWLKENKESKFNLDDIEHEDFVSENQPSYDPNDFNDAKITVKARSLMEEQDRRYRQEIDELRASVDEGNMKEELQTASNASIAEVVKIADEGYLKVVQDGGGDALKDSDPIAHDVLNEVLSQHDKHLYELEKLTHPSKKFRVSTSNKVHKDLLEFAAKKEADIMKLPQGEQVHEGKRFVTAKQWASMPQNQRMNYWTLQPEHIKAMYISDIGGQAKERIESQRAVFDKYVKHKSGQKSSPKETKGVKKPQQRRAKTNPPAITGEAVSATGSSQTASVDIGDKSRMSKRLWG